MVRYLRIITIQLRRERRRISISTYDSKWRSGGQWKGHLDTLKVDLRSKCEEKPYLGMDESCKAR